MDTYLKQNVLALGTWKCRNFLELGNFSGEVARCCAWCGSAFTSWLPSEEAPTLARTYGGQSVEDASESHFVSLKSFLSASKIQRQSKIFVKGSKGQCLSLVTDMCTRTYFGASTIICAIASMEEMSKCPSEYSTGLGLANKVTSQMKDRTPEH